MFLFFLHITLVGALISMPQKIAISFLSLYRNIVCKNVLSDVGLSHTFSGFGTLSQVLALFLLLFYVLAPFLILSQLLAHSLNFSVLFEVFGTLFNLT